MEFHELLENEKFKAAIGPDKLTIYSGENGADVMWEDFDKESAPVFTLGSEHKLGFWIQKWHGFFIWSDAETTRNGVAESLENFIGEYPFELESWRGSAPILYSDYVGADISLETVKAFAVLLISNEDKITINDEEFLKVGEKLISYSDALEDYDNVILEILMSHGDEDSRLDIHKWGGFYVSQYDATGENICTESLVEHIWKFLGIGSSMASGWRPYTTELKSDQLSLDELKALGLIFLSVESSTAEDGWCVLPDSGQPFSSQITINGKTYERHNGELVEVSS
jgi:hypothetical protein